MPNTFSSELTRMMSRQMGAKYFMNTPYIRFLRNAEESSISWAIAFRPTARVMRKQVASAPMGIITEFVRKSKKSSMSIPRTRRKSSALYPSAQSVPSPSRIAATSAVHFFRL